MWLGVIEKTGIPSPERVQSSVGGIDTNHEFCIIAWSDASAKISTSTYE